jgi:hypothetical protein
MWSQDVGKNFSFAREHALPPIPSPRLPATPPLSANDVEGVLTSVTPHVRSENKPTSALDEPDREIRVPPAIPQAEMPRSHFQCLVQWEGVVTSVANGEFEAELKELSDPHSPRESGTFSMEDVSDNDRDFVTVGAVFYWVIGYRTSRGGQKTKESRIRFRRLPTWTPSQLRDAVRRADELKELFGEP